MKPKTRKLLDFLSTTAQFSIPVIIGLTVNPYLALPLALGPAVIQLATKKYRSKRKDNKAFPVSSSASFTPREDSLLKSVFGKDIKLDNVKKYFSSKEKHREIIVDGKTYPTRVRASVFDKKTMKFYGADYQTEDFSQTNNSKIFETSMHEATHIMQEQRRFRDFVNTIFHPKRRTRKYEYSLSEKSRFKHFGVEQQATIIEDYSRLFLFPGGYRPVAGYVSSHHGVSNIVSVESPELLQKVVEDRFPEARKTRLSLEKREGQQSQERFVSELSSKSSFDDLSPEIQADAFASYNILLSTAPANFLVPQDGTTVGNLVKLVEKAYPDFGKERLALAAPKSAPPTARFPRMSSPSP